MEKFEILIFKVDICIEFSQYVNVERLNSVQLDSRYSNKVITSQRMDVNVEAVLQSTTQN